MAFWSGAKLREDGAAKNIVAEFDEKQIDCSAYTLRMGAEAYVTPSHDMDFWKNKKQNLKEPEQLHCFENILKKRGDTVVIPPGMFAFLLTEEIVKIPSNTMGFISLKSRIKFKGLVNVSGFHVDPGFQGNLIYSVFNAGPSPIHIARGDNLFLLWIADLIGADEKKYTRLDKPPQLEISTALISEVDRDTYSLKTLSDKVEKISKSFFQIKLAAALIVVAFGIVAGWPKISEWLAKELATSEVVDQAEPG